MLQLLARFRHIEVHHEVTMLGTYLWSSIPCGLAEAALSFGTQCRDPDHDIARMQFSLLQCSPAISSDAHRHCPILRHSLASPWLQAQHIHCSIVIPHMVQYKSNLSLMGPGAPCGWGRPGGPQRHLPLHLCHLASPAHWPGTALHVPRPRNAA